MIRSLTPSLLLLGSVVAHAQDDSDPPPDASDGPVVEQIDEEQTPVPIVCRRTVGLAGGLFEPGRSWQFTGPIGMAGSPVLGLSCDVGGDRAFSATFETLPLYVTRDWGSSEGRRQWWNVSLGALLDNVGRVRFGPLATVGWRRAGLGVRVLHLPFGPANLPTGFEYRLQAFYNGGLEVQSMITYTLTTDRYPR